MRRRQALAGLLACAAAAYGQAPAGRWTLGYLGPSAETAPRLLTAFRAGLAAYGYEEGRNLVVHYRWTNAGVRMNDDATLTASAREFVAAKVDVIVASIDPAIVAARRAAGGVTPIVMLNASDPVGLGFVASLSRPGGNVTGLTNQSTELIGKKVQVLLEVAPATRTIGMLVSGPSALRDEVIARTRTLAASRGIGLVVAEATSAAALDGAFAELKRGRADALFVADTGGGVFFTERVRLVELTRQNRLPAMFSNAEVVEAGGLMAYAPNSVDNYRRAAMYIDRILRGTRPGDLPVELPTKFELTVNAATAKAMGITFPQSLMLQVDRVVQ